MNRTYEQDTSPLTLVVQLAVAAFASEGKQGNLVEGHACNGRCTLGSVGYVLAFFKVCRRIASLMSYKYLQRPLVIRGTSR